MTTLKDPTDVEVIHAGRQFGRPTLTVKERVQQDVPPEIGSIFVEDLIKNSAILALPAVPTRDQILLAYATDIKAVTIRRHEADEFMLQVLTCALIRSSVDNRDEELKALKQLLQPLGIAPQIEMSAERAVTLERDLAWWLKDEFRKELDRIARRVATTLHYLADHNVVGLLDWKSPDICKFHYFTWSTKQEEATVSERTGDIFRWNTLTTTATTTTRVYRTRHTHHVVNAATHCLADYKKPMPALVKELVQLAPSWLKQHLLVIDGTETLTETVTDLADTKTSVKTTSVTRYDPAIAFGPFVFAGWSEDDLKPSPTKKAWANNIWKYLAIIWTAGLAWSLGSNLVEARSKQGYQYYMRWTLPGQELLSVPAGKVVDLPHNVRFTYLGVDTESHSILVAKWRTANNAWTADQEVMKIPIPHHYKETYYGNIELDKQFGVPLLLHVKSAKLNEMSFAFQVLPPKG